MTMVHFVLPHTSFSLVAILLLGRVSAASEILDGSSPKGGAIDLQGRVVWNELCPNYTDLGHSKVVLDDGKSHSGSILRNGSFLIPSVPEGSYILSVLAHDHSFDNLRVDVNQLQPMSTSDTAPQMSITARPYIPGTPHNPPSTISLPYPILLSPRQNVKKMYYVERESFGKGALGMVQSPMVLMMIVMGVLVVGLPYLIKNMDPELAKEFNERQARVSGIQNAMQSGDIRGGLSALLAETDPSNLGSSRTPSPQSGAGGSSKPGGVGAAKSKTSKGGRRR